MTKADPRREGLGDYSLWRVPYTVGPPSGKWHGSITVPANDADDAIRRAQAWHRQTPVTPTFTHPATARTGARVHYGTARDARKTR